MSQAFAAEEVRQKEQAEAILRRLNGRIKKADSESEVNMLTDWLVTAKGLQVEKSTQFSSMIRVL